MMKHIISLLFLFVVLNCFSQQKYLEKFSKVKKRTYTYQRFNNQENLKLDFYKPRKVKGEYPLLIYVHGGGFSGGKRDDAISKEFAEEMACYGYAVASISYRLTMQGLGFGCNTKANLKIKAFNEASKDISYAIKYILRRNRKFKINEKQIILVGSSAGAEAILNLAYVFDNTILGNDFKFAGIVSMAGAVTKVENITSKTAIPTQLFHGKKDKLVPYGTAPHHYCVSTDTGYLKLYGSKAIANKLKKIGKPYYLYTAEEGNHSWNSIPIFECKKEILDFLFFDVLKNQQRQTEVKI